MACYVLNTIDSRNKDIVNYVILIGQIPYFQRTCVEMAFEVEAYKFIALPAIQKLLDKIWLGNIVMENFWEKTAVNLIFFLIFKLHLFNFTLNIL